MKDDEVVDRIHRTVDLFAFRNITVIGDKFLNGYTNIVSIDLTPLVHLREIGSYFMRECTSLRDIAFDPNVRITKLSTGFLYRCSSLRTFDTSILGDLKELPSLFMAKCTSLEFLDLRHMNNLRRIGKAFLAESHVRTVYLPDNGRITEVGEQFLHGSRIQYFDTYPLRRLVRLPNYFMSLTNLTNHPLVDILDLGNFKYVVEIGEESLSGTMMPVIDLRGMIYLRRIHQHAFRCCMYSPLKIYMAPGVERIDNGLCIDHQGYRITVYVDNDSIGRMVHNSFADRDVKIMRKKQK